MIAEERLEIRTPDGLSDSLLYRDTDGRPRPGVIHLADIRGIRDSQRQMAERLVARGYVVLIPNVFYRTGHPPLWDFPPNFGEERAMKRFAELTRPLTPDAMERDMGAFVDFLAGQPFVAKGDVGVVGYCFTGKMTLYGAAIRPATIAAAASFHGGGLVDDTPSSPHLSLPRITKTRLYFGHAVEDRSMPPEAIGRLHRALEAWGGTYESETYDGARHGWTMPDHAAFSPSQAERAFDKLAKLLDSALRRA